MTSQQSKCEHCGMWVAPAKVCPKCRRDHSDEWIRVANENGSAADTWVAYPMIIWLVYALYKDYDWSTIFGVAATIFVVGFCCALPTLLKNNKVKFDQ